MSNTHMIEKYSKFKRREVCQIAYKDYFKNYKISFDLDLNRPSIKTLRKIVDLIFNDETLSEFDIARLRVDDREKRSALDNEIKLIEDAVS